LSRLRVASPCPVSWESMSGTNRVRYCAQCSLNVYNISELTREETKSLIASSEGRICARLFRRADGTLITRDCPVGLRSLHKRIARRATAMFAILSFSGGRRAGQEVLPAITHRNDYAAGDKRQHCRFDGPRFRSQRRYCSRGTRHADKRCDEGKGRRAHGRQG